MIVFIRCNDVFSDTRLMKYVDFVKSENLPHYIIGWNRSSSSVRLENSVFLNLNSDFGRGGIFAILKRIVWMIFVFVELFKRRSKISVIHACDLDAAFPASVFKVFQNSKVRVVFDVFDWFSDTLYDSGWFVTRMFKIMESFSTRKSDDVIICEEYRSVQIPKESQHKIKILPNIPFFKDDSFLLLDNRYTFKNDKITISYVGGFYNGRCLNELLNLAQMGICNLLIAGFGSLEIEKKCSELSTMENIKYFGRVDYHKGINIMYNSDLVYAMYSKINPNHIYAAPNKLYEAMLIGRPILSTKGIMIESKINSLNIGFCIDENMDDYMDVISNVSRDKLIVMGENAKSVWNLKYADYTKRFMFQYYLPLLRQALQIKN